MINTSIRKYSDKNKMRYSLQVKIYN